MSKPSAPFFSAKITIFFEIFIDFLSFKPSNILLLIFYASALNFVVISPNFITLMLQETCAKVLINATNAAKVEGFHAVAHAWISFATNLHNLPLHLLHSVELLKSQLYWDKQETHTSR